MKGTGMQYRKNLIMKNGQAAILRSGVASDGQAALDVFNLTHEETDFLLSYPDESSMDAEQESEFLERKTASANEVEILALVEDQVVGMAGIDAVGACHKVSHRAEFGISLAKAYWGLGLGTALTKACVQCAKDAGYSQVELEVVADNVSAIHLYQKLGFVEYGRNPKGFCSRVNGYQELIYMRLDLEDEKEAENE